MFSRPRVASVSRFEYSAFSVKIQREWGIPARPLIEAHLGELLGDENGESRHAAATAYRRILQEARYERPVAQVKKQGAQADIPHYLGPI